eukprot:TRINITY_DN41148_c0_g1_i1.p1 TRINITY_DN41148_c0_g1~~TRINITY_DN41148_c0_g1_i1.p1  ORF type:complete len:267 (+),score=66.69 TRINITY_DN41148_c0_g1_i1:96-896(+)
MAHMMAMKDPRMAYFATVEFHKFLFDILPGSQEDADAALNKMRKGVKGFVKNVKRGIEKAGSFSLNRSSSSLDTTDEDTSGMEISSEAESVWSDEDIYYPTARELSTSDVADTRVARRSRRCKTINAKTDAETPLSLKRRARRTKSWHTPRASWIDCDSDGDDDLTSADEKQRPLPRSHSLHALLFGQEGNSAEMASRRLQSKNEVRFEIGSSDDDEVLLDILDPESHDGEQENSLHQSPATDNSAKPASPLGTLGAALKASEVGV